MTLNVFDQTHRKAGLFQTIVGGIWNTDTSPSFNILSLITILLLWPKHFPLQGPHTSLWHILAVNKILRPQEAIRKGHTTK